MSYLKQIIVVVVNGKLPEDNLTSVNYYFDLYPTISIPSHHHGFQTRTPNASPVRQT